MKTWLRNLWNDLTGPYSYRVWGIVAATVLGGYFGLYAALEARHDRQKNESLFQRDVFLTLVSSGVRGDFITGMREFGTVQNISIYSAPELGNPFTWWDTRKPNMDPLWRWARHRLEWCEESLCGGGRYRLDLRDTDLRGAKLRNVELHESDLRNADLRAAILEGANLNQADLEAADLEAADLRKAVGIECDELKKAKNWQKAFRDRGLACGAEIPVPERRVVASKARSLILDEATLLICGGLF